MLWFDTVLGWLGGLFSEDDSRAEIDPDG